MVNHSKNVVSKLFSVLLLLALPLSLHAQWNILFGFEPVPFDIDSQIIEEPFIITRASHLLEWTKKDFNPLEYRSVTLAYDTGSTCSLSIESRHPGLRHYPCSMVPPYSGRSSLAFSPAYTDSPWEGNDGMYIHELDEPLRKNTRYNIQIKLYIHDHYHDSVSTAGINVYLLKTERELDALSLWDPIKLEEHYRLAQEYPDQFGEYWLGSGRQPTMKWITVEHVINPVKEIKFIILGAQRNVPDHINVMNAPIVLDELRFTRND